MAAAPVFFDTNDVYLFSVDYPEKQRVAERCMWAHVPTPRPR